MIKKTYFNEYEINQGTNFVQGLDRTKCIVGDETKEGLFLESVISVMNNGCVINGSTLSGRNEAAIKLTGFKYKAPIIMSESNKIVFFPCDSHRSTKCIWINLKKVKQYEAKNNGTLIEFVDGKKKFFDVSSYIINNQYNKALKLYYTMFESDMKKHYN